MDLGTKEKITYADFERFPVWMNDRDREIYIPFDLDMEGDVEDIQFRAKFTTPGGHELLGVVKGPDDYSIAIFRNGRWYGASRAHLQDIWLAQLIALAEDSPELGAKSGRDLLPLKFQTTINMEPYIDWSGEFDIDLTGTGLE